MRRTLLSTAAAVAGFVFAAAAGATPFSFDPTAGPSGDLGPSATLVSGGVILTLTAVGANDPHVFAKLDGPDEDLWGETKSPNGDNEITSDNGRGILVSVAADPGLSITSLFFAGNSTNPHDTGAILAGGIQVATFDSHAAIDLTAFLSEPLEVVALPLTDQPAGSNDTVGIGLISGTTSSTPAPVPEPGTLAIVATGLFALAAMRRVRR